MLEQELKDKKVMVQQMQAEVLDGDKKRIEAVHEKQMEKLWKQTAEANAKAAQQAAREALKKVTAAKKSDDKDVEEADKAAMEAESATLAQCTPIWDTRHAEVLKELEECKTTKADLNTVHAQSATLQQTVQANQA